MRRLVVRAASILAALMPSGAAVAQHREVSPEAAPQAWVDYAGQVNQALIGWLGVDTPDGVAVRTYLDGMRPSPDQPTAEMLFRLWIDRSGKVTRAEFPPLADEAINQKLRGLVVGQQLAPPPKDLLLPLRLAVQLAPVPQSPGVDTATSSGPTI